MRRGLAGAAASAALCVACVAFDPNRPAASPGPLKRGPKTTLSDADLVGEIRAVLAASPFHGEGHRKVREELRPTGRGSTRGRRGGAGSSARSIIASRTLSGGTLRKLPDYWLAGMAASRAGVDRPDPLRVLSVNTFVVFFLYGDVQTSVPRLLFILRVLEGLVASDGRLEKPKPAEQPA